MALISTRPPSVTVTVRKLPEIETKYRDHQGVYQSTQAHSLVLPELRFNWSEEEASSFT